MSRKSIQRQFGLNTSGSEEEDGSPMDFGTPPQSSMQSTSGSFDSGLSGSSCRREGVSRSCQSGEPSDPMVGGGSNNVSIMEEITGIKQSLSDIGEMFKVLEDRMTSLERMALLSSSEKPAEADLEVLSDPFTSGNQPEFPLEFLKSFRDRRRSDSVLAGYQRLKNREAWKTLKSLTVNIPESEDRDAEELGEKHSTQDQKLKPSAIPEELAGEKLSTREQKLRSSVKSYLPKFIEQTNWKFILPHLVSVDLSDKSTTDFLLNETKSDQDKGVHFYLQVLPSKGDDAYTRFYTCLCNEKEHLGHKSLLEILNE